MANPQNILSETVERPVLMQLRLQLLVASSDSGGSGFRSISEALLASIPPNATLLEHSTSFPNRQDFEAVISCDPLPVGGSGDESLRPALLLGLADEILFWGAVKSIAENRASSLKVMYGDFLATNPDVLGSDENGPVSTLHRSIGHVSQTESVTQFIDVEKLAIAVKSGDIPVEALIGLAFPGGKIPESKRGFLETLLGPVALGEMMNPSKVSKGFSATPSRSLKAEVSGLLLKLLKRDKPAES